MVKYFSSTLADLPVKSRYSVENPLAPASEEKNSTVDVFSEVLRNPIGDHFLEIFCKF